MANAALATAFSAPKTSSKRPNIVVILADDMGFSDIGCYGSEIPTPHIDSLAQNGVKFSQFYNGARCCPTRASLLTGLYAHQAGVGHMVDKAGPEPGYRNDLNHQCLTIAEALKPAGYRTLMAGKWHVTPANGSKENWPVQRGFDRYYGIIHGAASYFNPVTLTRQNSPVAPEGDRFYLTDSIGDEAARMVKEFAGKTDPFFLYAAFTAPHWPMQAFEEDIRKYERRYNGGWDELRRERHSRQLRAGLVRRDWDLTARDATAPAWTETPDKEWEARRMAVYAAMVDRLDQNVGKILNAIRESGAEADTLVVFLSDNGGCAEVLGPNAGGIHIPDKTRGGEAVRRGNVPGLMPGPENTYQSYGLAWANASNTPFRMYKHWVHEGGISTPFLMRWPARIRPNKGWISEPGHIVDIMATCLDAAGATYPRQALGRDLIPLAGRSLLPVAAGGSTPVRTLFWEHEGNCAARRGPWKLVRKYEGSWELYDMQADRTELHDVSASNSKTAAQLADSWQAWADRSGVLPWDRVKGALHNRALKS